MYGIIVYAMALTISEEERNLIRPVAALAYASVALVNDIFSWQREYDDFKHQSETQYMANAIWILMQEHSITVEKAQQSLQKKAADYCQEYLRRKAEFVSLMAISVDAGRYLSALELLLSGNVGFSQYCPRYSFSETLPTSSARKVADGSPIKEANQYLFASEHHTNEENRGQTGILPSSTLNPHY